VDSGVASSDDIHNPVEKPGNKREKEEKAGKPSQKLPGQFVSDELKEQTARFLEDVKGRAQRRKERAADEGFGPPPRGNQRSSRR
jgi:hypothetical protein